MTEEEKRIQEIDEQIEKLTDERVSLKNKIDAESCSQILANYFSKIEVKLFFDNVLILYYYDDDGVEVTKKHMDNAIKCLLKELGNPPCYDLQDARVDNHYIFIPHFRVLVFNTGNISETGWDKLSDVIEKLKKD